MTEMSPFESYLSQGGEGESVEEAPEFEGYGIYERGSPYVEYLSPGAPSQLPDFIFEPGCEGPACKDLVLEEEAYYQEHALWGEYGERALVFTSEFNYKCRGGKSMWVHLHVSEKADKCTSMCRKIKQHREGPGSREDFEEPAGRRRESACTQCGTRETPLWRRVRSKLVCNACGLYFRTHAGGTRPERLFKHRSNPLYSQHEDEQDRGLSDENESE